MRILYFGYPSGIGCAPHQKMAAVYLARKGHLVDYVCWGGHADDHKRNNDNINYIPYPKKGILSAINLFIYLFSVLFLSRNYDVAYIQGAQQTPFLFWAPLLIKGRISIIYHTQDYLEPRRHRFYEGFERWFARHATYTISNEVNRARFMKSYYGLLYMPAVLRTALPAWWRIPKRSEEKRAEILALSGVKDTEQAVVVIAGGPYRADRMSPQLVEAFSRLPENYVLVFNGSVMELGKGCRIACEQKMEEMGISERVVFIGGVSFEELLVLYSIGEIGVLLYPNDGVGHYYQCPGRFSEYLRCGLLLVSSNFPGLELLTLKYKLGAVCDPEDPVSIASALLEAGSKAKVNRKRIIEVAEQEFVYERGSSILDEILEGTYVHFRPSVST